MFPLVNTETFTYFMQNIFWVVAETDKPQKPEGVEAQKQLEMCATKKARKKKLKSKTQKE